MEKLTKKQKFEMVLSHLTNEEERKFIEHEIEMLDKKNSRKSTKPTANQEANMEIKDAIVEWLTENGEPMTATEMMKTIPACAEASNQKLSALLRQLRVDEVVKSEKVKGTTYFSLV